MGSMVRCGIVKYEITHNSGKINRGVRLALSALWLRGCITIGLR